MVGLWIFEAEVVLFGVEDDFQIVPKWPRQPNFVLGGSSLSSRGFQEVGNRQGGLMGLRKICPQK
jgi:hypothetical protein